MFSFFDMIQKCAFVFDSDSLPVISNGQIAVRILVTAGPQSVRLDDLRLPEGWSVVSEGNLTPNFPFERARGQMFRLNGRFAAAGAVAPEMVLQSANQVVCGYVNKHGLALPWNVTTDVQVALMALGSSRVKFEGNIEAYDADESFVLEVSIPVGTTRPLWPVAGEVLCVSDGEKTACGPAYGVVTLDCDSVMELIQPSDFAGVIRGQAYASADVSQTHWPSLVVPLDWMQEGLQFHCESLVASIGGGESFEIPIASATQLGGIRVGDGLRIDPETGALSNSAPGSSYRCVVASTAALTIYDASGALVAFDDLPPRFIAPLAIGSSDQYPVLVTKFESAVRVEGPDATWQWDRSLLTMTPLRVRTAYYPGTGSKFTYDLAGLLAIGQSVIPETLHCQRYGRVTHVPNTGDGITGRYVAMFGNEGEEYFQLVISFVPSTGAVSTDEQQLGYMSGWFHSGRLRQMQTWDLFELAFGSSGQLALKASGTPVNASWLRSKGMGIRGLHNTVKAGPSLSTITRDCQICFDFEYGLSATILPGVVFRLVQNSNNQWEALVTKWHAVYDYEAAKWYAHGWDGAELDVTNIADRVTSFADVLDLRVCLRAANFGTIGAFQSVTSQVLSPTTVQGQLLVGSSNKWWRLEWNGSAAVVTMES